MRKLIFAANWKMQLGPAGARKFLGEFLAEYEPVPDREVWFFPPAVSLETVAGLTRGKQGIVTGAQNVFWEAKGAFTGELSVEMVQESGAGAALIGHSERRHVFGETDEETGKKVRAVLAGGLLPVLCVGELIEEREAGETIAVVERQLSVLEGLDPDSLVKIQVAYEPVWAIGTGKTATPADAAEVHQAIKQWFADRLVVEADVSVLYGGSVKPENAGTLVAEPEVDGVLVGGASLDPQAWLSITRAG
ncbi:MAG: triose-phosphate isomerase [Gemmatimonadales bacterium]|jgi:triosephosphate isomerase